MAQSGGILRADPFGVPGVAIESGAAAASALRQAWLTQLLFYGLYSLGGFQSLILLRALLGTAIFATVFLLVRRSGAHPLLSLLLLWVAVKIVFFEFAYVSERPQLWSSLFFPLAFRLLERLREGDRRAAWALPPLLCLWGNLHGGFLIGDALIAIYLAAALLQRRATARLWVAGGAALLASGLNPAGFTPAVVVARSLGDPAARALSLMVVENQSIFAALGPLRAVKAFPALGGLMALTGLSFLPLLRRRGEIRLEWLALYVFTLALAVAGMRYIVFFATLAPVILAGNLVLAWRGWSWGGRVRVERLAAPPWGAAATLLVAALLAAPNVARAARESALFREKPYNTDYDGAAAFLRDNALAGNLFNRYTDGGLLVWKLPRGIKVFADGRGLGFSLEALRAHQALLERPLEPAGDGTSRPLYAALLERYGLDFVLMPSCDEMGRIYLLVNGLAKDPGWALVYADAEALLFTRIAPGTRDLVVRRRLGKEAIFDNIISVAGRAARDPHGGRATQWMLTTAYAHWWKGDAPGALKWLERYLAGRPRDREALQLRDQLLAGRPPGHLASPP